MVNRRTGIGTAAIGIIAVIAVVAILAFTALSFQPSNQSTSNTSSVSTSNTPSFQVLRTNVTVPYDAGCMVLEQIGHTCPTVTANPETSNSSLRGLELISYQGTDYYAGCFGKGPCGNGSYFNGVSTVPYPNVWFTNSTIFCVSPLYGNYATCPVNESLPSVYW